MKFAIPRGIIYHRVLDDIKWLIKSFYCELQEKKIIFEFEKSFANLLGTKFCVAFPFARTAIYFALKSRNLPEGTEVIMPPISIKGILDVVLALGLKPVFVDLNPDTLCFDIEALRKAVGKDTKAIVITYLYGIVPNVELIVEISRENGLFVIEDFSQCLNGCYKEKKVGGFGDIGVYSSSSIKTLDTYGGGLLICNDESLYRDMIEEQSKLASPLRMFLISKIFTDLIRNVATSRIVFGVIIFPLLKLLNYFKPNSVIKQTGERYMGMLNTLPSEWFTSYTSLQAEVGLRILKELEKQDEERLSNVAKIKAATDTTFPTGVDGGRNIYWQLIAYFDDTSAVQKIMHQNGVDTARTSLLLISDLPAYPYRANTPNAASLYVKGLFVPAYVGLSDSDVQHVINVLNGLYEV